MNALTLENAEQVLHEAMPGCVRALSIAVTALGDGAASLTMPASEAACREGGIFAGQAIAALADSAMCFALWRDGRGRRPVATVDLHVTYLRGLGNESLIAHAEVVRAGRTLSFAKVQIVGAGSGQLAATAIGTFAWPA
ncbi:PaaI family thioesterase [uncultured Pseudacidovorax sp.]|uniref:PaaI family thioesterase n=1 Tax=uncultured Pseudacidovorax sp. TaxID=679313 RepID=UPI0025DED3EA|nr:PaaI family thioesterase [uncultured Pseudacidovorax sp.]